MFIRMSLLALIGSVMGPALAGTIMGKLGMKVLMGAGIWTIRYPSFLGFLEHELAALGFSYRRGDTPYGTTEHYIEQTVPRESLLGHLRLFPYRKVKVAMIEVNMGRVSSMTIEVYDQKALKAMEQLAWKFRWTFFQWAWVFRAY